MGYRIFHILSIVIRRLFSAALRTVITGLVFTICLMLTLRYMGVPVPSPSELLERFEGLAKLAEILS
jgi:hypothetical protein